MGQRLGKASSLPPVFNIEVFNACQNAILAVKEEFCLVLGAPMVRENRQLVTDEPVEFEK